MTTVPHVRLVAAGTLGAGANEIWSCSLKIQVSGGATPGIPSQINLDQIAGNCMTPWVDLIKHVEPASVDGSLFSSWVRLTYLKASAVLASGKDDPSTQSAVQDAPIGTLGAGQAGVGAPGIDYELPYSVAMVLTMTGNLYQRGSAAFGRIYLPIPNLHYSSDPNTVQHMVDGALNDTVVQEFASVGATLIRGLNSAMNSTNLNGVTGRVVNIGASSAAAGVRVQPVTNVSCDNRPDTVRRRSNKISGQGRKTAGV